MAELALKIGDSPDPDGYKDGDILCAFSDHRIASVHLGSICHRRNATPNARTNLIEPGTSLVETMQSETRQYKFKTVTEDRERKLKRITLADMSEEVFDEDPSLYIRRRLQSAKKAMFGEPGSEYWFGGRTNLTPAKVSTVWDAVELATPHRRTDPERVAWPMGTKDGFDFLFIRSRDFSEPRRHEYEAEHIDDTDPDNSIRLAARKHFIDWQSDLGLSAASRTEIQDRTIYTDRRLSSSHDDRVVVQAKEGA